MTNKSFLKKLLATTAVVGTLAAGAMEAQAAARLFTSAGNVAWDANLNWNPAGNDPEAWIVAAVGNTVSLSLGHNLSLTGSAGARVITATGFTAPVTVTMDDASNYTFNGAVTGPGSFAHAAAAAGEYTFQNNTDLSGVTNFDFVAQARTVHFINANVQAAPVNITTVFHSTGGAAGTVAIGGGWFKLTGIGNLSTGVGATQVNSLTIANGAGLIIDNQNFANLVNGATLTGDGTLVFNSGMNVGSSINGGAGNNGIVTFLGSSTLNAHLGNATTLNTVNINGAVGSIVALNGNNIKVGTAINFGGAGTLGSANGDSTLVGAITTSGGGVVGGVNVAGGGVIATTATGGLIVGNQVGTAANMLDTISIAGSSNNTAFAAAVYARTISVAATAGNTAFVAINAGVGGVTVTSTNKFTSALIQSAGAVAIGQNAANGANIVLAGVTTTGASDITLLNNNGSITLGGAIQANGTGNITITQTDTAALPTPIVGGGNNIVAVGGNITINAGYGGVNGNLGNITALGAEAEVNYTTGNAGAIVGSVQTGEFNFGTIGGNIPTVLTLGAGTAISTGLGLSDNGAAAVTTVNFANGAAGHYIAEIALAVNNKHILNFNPAGAEFDYVGSVGSDGNAAAQFNVNGAGTVAILNDSEVFSKQTKFLANGTLILGNGSKVLSAVITGVNNTGTIQLQDVQPGAAPAAGAAIVAKAPVGAAIVQAIINDGIGDSTNSILNIDFNQTLNTSSLTVNGTNAANDVGVYTKGISFSKTAAQIGTLALTGGNNHVITVGANNVMNAAQGAISSDTANTLTITAGADIGAAGTVGVYTDNALSSLSAPNATTVTLAGTDAYIKSVTMKEGGNLVLGKTAGANYLIGGLNDGVNVMSDNGAAVLTLVSGTNLGKFASLKLGATTTAFNIQDKVNILGAAPVTFTAPNATVVSFQGTSNVTSDIGTAAASAKQVNILADINVGDVVTLGNVFALNGVHIGGGVNHATATINGNVTGPAATASIVNEDVAGVGVVNFGATAGNTATISGDISGPLFASTNITNTGTTVIQNATKASTGAINYTADGNLTLQNIGATAITNLGVAPITTTVNNTGTLSVDASIVRTVQIGATGLAMKELNINKGATYTVNGVSAFTSFTTATNNTGVINVNTNAAGITTIGNIGTATALFANTNIIGGAAGAANALVAGDIYATNSTIGTVGGVGGGFFNIGNTGGTLKMLNNTAASSDTLNVLDGSTLGLITTSADKSGILVFQGSGTISKDIGTNIAGLQEVSLLNGNVNLSTANIYAPVNHAAAAKLIVTQNSQITGGYTAKSGASLALGSSTLNVDTGTLGEVYNISSNFNLGAAYGKVVFTTLNGAADGTTVNVTPTVVANSILLPTDGAAFTVLSAGTINNSIKLVTPKLISTNSFLELTGGVSADGKSITYTSKRNLSSLQKNVTVGDAGQLAAMFNAQSSTLSDDALLMVSTMGNENDAEKKDTLERATGSNKVHVSMDVAARSMANAVGGRLAALGVGTIATSSADDLGAAAGDDSMKMGAWISGFAGQGNQGSRKGIAGFKSKVAGGVVGFDTAFNDSTIIGLAAGTANIKTKYKNEKSGDTTKATTYLFSLYGSYDYGNNWVAQASAMFGNGSVKNSALRRAGSGAGNYETAHGKFDTVTGAGEVLGGYKFVVGEAAAITPLAGLSYMRSSENAYKETGTTFSNFNISDRTQEKLEGIIGVRANTSADMDGTIVTPEFHAFLNYDFKAKAPKVTVKLSGLDGAVPSGSAKPARVTCNLGAGVMAKSDMIEYGVAYDSQISDKYFGHQGTLKLRVNF